MSIIDHPAASSRMPPLLDAEQAGALLSVQPSWLWAAARRGEIPHVKVGRYIRFREKDLLDWIDDHVSGGT